MKLPEIETKIKIDINIAITVSVSIIMLFNLLTTHQTTVEVQETKKEVREKIGKTDDKLDVVLNKTFDRLNQYGNLSALNDKQIIQIVKQILKEVK